LYYAVIHLNWNWIVKLFTNYVGKLFRAKSEDNNYGEKIIFNFYEFRPDYKKNKYETFLKVSSANYRCNWFFETIFEFKNRNNLLEKMSSDL